MRMPSSHSYCHTFRRAPRKYRTALSFILTIAVLLAASSTSNSVTAAPSQEAQVFDIKLGKIVHTFPNTPELRLEVEKWIGSIEGLVAAVNPEPLEGVIIRIPLNPVLQINNEWLRNRAVQAFLFVSHSTVDKPALLLLDEQEQPMVYRLKMSAGPFLDQYGLRRYLDSGMVSNNPTNM
ncbi:hypothetical protein [Paenibacillus koleovorans]|uniref:hypothetical protein n=1 Tax=Paenibacillus koleovorans TaxID=121608 RepID=UPI000FD8BA8D|nr:hypothetical protein [Paenibacillus koleovorans]